MDTPLPKQIRTAQPDAECATEEDSMELMEMVLGALGRDALGLGSSIEHPRESEEWKVRAPVASDMGMNEFQACQKKPSGLDCCLTSNTRHSVVCRRT